MIGIMKNIIFIILIICFTTKLYGQCRINQTNPSSFLKEIKELRANKEYSEIIKIIQVKMDSDSAKVWHYYQLACFHSLKKDTIKSFNYLYKAIKMGAYGDDILSDTDFEPLHSTKKWRSVKDTLIIIYLNRYPDIKNKDLSVKLWLMGIDDQSTRSLRSNYKKPFPDYNTREWKKLNRQFRKEAKKRTKFILSLINEGYYPLYSDVGQEAADAALFIIQHSQKKKLFKKALPLLKDAVENKEANGVNYALVLDRYLMRTNKKQIYGTQYWRYSIDTTDEMSDLEFWPIENENEVNKRRASIGLDPIEEMARKRNILYDYKEKRIIVKNKRIRKKFHIE